MCVSCQALGGESSQLHRLRISQHLRPELGFKSRRSAALFFSSSGGGGHASRTHGPQHQGRARVRRSSWPAPRAQDVGGKNVIEIQQDALPAGGRGVDGIYQQSDRRAPTSGRSRWQELMRLAAAAQAGKLALNDIQALRFFSHGKLAVSACCPGWHHYTFQHRRHRNQGDPKKTRGLRRRATRSFDRTRGPSSSTARP